eukprot:PhF_6_TR34971/c0_g1_i1/m.50787/K00451/HGD, hmgA; homogentisate 1,2-dioxygenase
MATSPRSVDNNPKRRKTAGGSASENAGPSDPGYVYLRGFGNTFTSEALPNALPDVGVTPQVCPYGLYAEQFSGTSFTKVRYAMQHNWYYRIKPSVDHGEWSRVSPAPSVSNPTDVNTPAQMRWKPCPLPNKPTTWVEGLIPYAGAGSPDVKQGLTIYMYSCNTSMVDSAFCNADGDMLIVPQLGALDITTELGKMYVPPGVICVIQRGIRFSVNTPDGDTRGYVCEVYDSHFQLPPLGVIGTNGLANPQDFESPTAWYEDRTATFKIFQKFNGELFQYTQDHSPFDVVAWLGNCVPFRYDLAKFCTINTVSYDHLDPSIFCVITAQTVEGGVAVCDFVIFPPRWMVAEHTFRPPYYHKNIMSEFMGNIRGTYDAKEEGFAPGAGSLHSIMTAHGPEVAVFEKCTRVDLAPTKTADNMAFMFESNYSMKLSAYASTHNVDTKYQECWKGFKKYFDPANRDVKM